MALRMPWRGFEPRRLSALPPQDSVSTSFTTRAREPSISRVAVGSNLRGVREVSEAGEVGEASGVGEVSEVGEVSGVGG